MENQIAPDIVFKHLSPGLAGHYDHRNHAIILDPRHPRRTMRATVIHEHVHAARKHEPIRGPQDLAREMEVERESAEYAICFPQLVDAFTMFDSLTDMADYWGVDWDMACDRWMRLSNIDRVILDTCGRKCTKRFT